MNCEDIFYVHINNFFDYFPKSYLREEFVTIWPGDIGGMGVNQHGDKGGGGSEIPNFAVTSFLNSPKVAGFQNSRW